jgi:hypothetical protein
MCACIVFLVVLILAALMYTVIHAMWSATGGILVIAFLIWLFGRKAAAARKSGH